MSDVMGRHGHRAPSLTRRLLHVGLALLCVVLGGLAGLAYYNSVPPTYTASTTVLVLPTVSGLDSSVAGSRSEAEVQIETESELLLSAQVAAAASERLDGTLTSKQLLKGSSVTIPPNSQVMIVALVAGSPEKARDGAMALARAYLDRRASEASSGIDGVVTSLEAQVADLTARLKENSAALEGVPADNEAQREQIGSQRDLLVDQISDINSRLVALRIQSSSGGEIVSKAQLPDHATSPVLLLTVGGGLGVGLLAGGGLLLALNHVSGRRQEPVQRTMASRVPVLATLALSNPTGPVGPEDRMRFVDEDDVLRRLCVKISSYQGVPGPTVIVGVGDPLLRTQVGASLNRSWAAEFGASVLVLTEAGSHGAAAGMAPGARGLRDALRDDAAILDTVVVPVGSYAGVVGPGRDAHLVPSAAQRGLLPELWQQLEREFSAVLVESGSPLDSPLAQSVAQTAGRFVVLVEVGTGQQRDLTSTLEEIEWLTLADRVAGVVIVSNRPAPSVGDGPDDDQASPAADRAADVSGVFREQD